MKASSVCGMLVAAALLAVLCQTVSASKQLSREQELALDEYFASLPADIREKANHVVQGLLQVQDKESRAARSDENVFCQDPDCGKNVTQLITSKGYPCEDHYALTPDGYWLSLQRIPYGIAGNATAGAGVNGTRPVVFLQHGLLDASHTWVINMPSESLGFILADAGYEVWLGNNRGNTYSNTNEYYSYDDDDFWNFSWDEMANVDLPTMIDYVLAETGEEQVYYVGHSEGTTQAFAGFQNATLASKIKLFVALAPVAYADHCASKFLVTLAAFRIDDLLVILGFDHFLVQSDWMDAFLDATCDFDDGAVCNDAMCAIMGCDPDNFNSTRWDVYADLDPAGTSVQNINHWGQMVRKHEFCYYSYLTAHENKKHYGSRQAPCYDLSTFAAPVALFSGGKDDLADPTDVADLTADLPQDLIVYTNEISYYSHLDFVWGMDAYDVLYPQVLNLFAERN